jgi:hypothetical protein
MQTLHALNVALVLGSLGLLHAADKSLSWQVGKVLDSETSQKLMGSIGSSTTSGDVTASPGHATFGSVSTSMAAAVFRRYETFVIETATHIYVARQELKWKRSKPANLTINGLVKFAVKSRKLWLIDDDGKQHELEVMKKILKHPEQSPH